MTGWDDIRQGEMVRTLQDAGCDEEQIRRFLQFLANDRRRDAQRLLRKHRQALLDRCHAEEHKIDCLDYLTYQMEHTKT